MVQVKQCHHRIWVLVMSNVQRDKTRYRQEREDNGKGQRHPRMQVLVMSNVQRDKAKKWRHDVGGG